MNLNVKTHMEMKPVAQVMAARGVNPGGKVQQYMVTQLAGIFDGYVPLRSGTLKNSVFRNIRAPFDKLVYDGPYAARMYYNPQYRFSEAPKRGAYWDKRAMADHKDTFVKNVQNAVKTGRI